MSAETIAFANLLISKIDIGSRRREKVGSLASLKSSLERVGQIHAITVRLDGAGFDLVAGARRLQAAEALGWKKIWARVGRFTDEQLREIELDENVIRLDLTEFEASKARLRQIEEAEQEAEAEVPAQAGPKGGRPRGGGNEAARRTGLSRQEVQRTKRHVAIAEEYPIFQCSDWKRSQALAAEEALEQLSKRDQETAIEMISEPGIPPKIALNILDGIADCSATERRDLLDLYRTGDPQKQKTAKTRAIKLPPPPHPALIEIGSVIRSIERVLKTDSTRGRVALRRAVSHLKLALKENNRVYQALRKKEGWDHT